MNVHDNRAHEPESAGLLNRLITADPGLPRPSPTESYWQLPPHSLAGIQSSFLPEKTDFAIIGSGITGLSVAKTLLERDAAASVTVLEARAICSGATGRNGGQLAPNAGEEYVHLVKTYGEEMAGNIVRFTFQNLEKMHELSEEYASDACEVQRVQKVRAFLTEDMFNHFTDSVALLERDHPDLKGLYTIIDANTILNEYGIVGAAGGGLVPAGTVWPYRLVTKVWEELLNRYPTRLGIETYTPVTSVKYEPLQNSDSYDYSVITPRGTISTAKVVYCTNGYTGHLLPELRGRIHPKKGTMTVQDPANSLPNQGQTLSWAFHYPAAYDPNSGRYGHGLYYLAQSAKTAYFYFGGEDTRFEDTLTADDSSVTDYAVANLRNILPVYFGQNADRSKNWRLMKAWSGIMGYSADELPIVGKLPPSLTQREGNGEWIAAAFNGYGMANCLLTGEALARMMLNEDVSEWFPEAYLISEQRLRQTLTVEGAVENYSLNHTA